MLVTRGVAAASSGGLIERRASGRLTPRTDLGALESSRLTWSSMTGAPCRLDIQAHPACAELLCSTGRSLGVR